MSGKILVGEHQGIYIMRFVGDVRVTLSGSFDNYLRAMLADPKFDNVLVDLSDAVAIDSTSLGVLAKLSIGLTKSHGRVPTLVCYSQDILRVLENMGFDDIFEIVEENLLTQNNLAELAMPKDYNENTMRTKVIDAHKVLMTLNERNHNTFKDLVSALEAESSDANSAIR